MRIVVSRTASKALGRLPTGQAKRVRDRIAQLGADVRNLDVKAPRGSTDYRLRVGPYRVVFARDEETITIKDVLHRREAYR